MTTAIWGITFESEIDLPGLDAGDAAVDVQIRHGAVPDSLPDPRSEGAAYQAAPGRFLSWVPGVASYLVEGGSTITVQAAPGADAGAVRLLLLGTPMGALLHQRGRVPLHASAVEIDGGAVVFAGASAAGKSALVAALHDAGHRVLADDVCAVSAAGDGSIVAEVGPTEVLLWRDTLELTGRDPTQVERARAGLEKYRVPVAVPDGPRRVDRIVVLGVHGRPTFVIERYEPFGRIRALLGHTRGSGYLDGLGAGPFHFRTTSGIAKSVPMHYLLRPLGESSIDELVTEMRALLDDPGDDE